MRLEHWNIDAALKREAEENYRTRFALSLAGRPTLQIVRELTFDGAAQDITIEDLERLLRWIESSLLRKSFSGTGVELGAGPLVFSSILARFSKVKKMYGIEICEPIVERLFPDVARDIAGPNVDKVIGVIGSFDEMELPDASVDFMFDFFSLHHSLDIVKTFGEISRALKPGGFLLMLDKARPDSLTDDDLEAMLDARYGQEFNKFFGLAPEQVMTRRRNGEREYRLRDWKHAAFAAGFTDFEYWRVEKSGNNVIKKTLSLFPSRIQALVTSFLPKPRQSHRFILDASHRVFTPLLNHFRKEMSVMVIHRGR